jgi:hypothetical protein
LPGRIIAAALGISITLVLVTVGAQSVRAAAITWTYKGIAYKEGLNAIDCPSAKLCVGAGYDAAVVSTDPTGPAKDWHKYYIDRERDPNGNAAELTSIGCVSAALCVTGDDSQNGWFATKPDSGGWSPFEFPSDTYVTVEGIGCSPLGNCTALSVDGREMSSSDPTTGMFSFVSLPHTNPNDVSGSAPAQISCPNQTCVIAWDASGVWVTHDAGTSFSWVPIKHAGVISKVDCVTSSFCIAAAEEGAGENLFISRNPASSSSWKDVPAFKGSGPAAVACPSTGLCIAVEGKNTYSSTNPTVAGSWKPDAGVGFHGIGSELSCPTAGECIDSDQFGGISVAKF